MPAGEEALSLASCLKAACRRGTWRDPAHGEPHCSKHEGESPDLHACICFLFLLSCRTSRSTSRRLQADRSRQPGCLSRRSDSLGNCLPGQVALPLHQPCHQAARYSHTVLIWSHSKSEAGPRKLTILEDWRKVHVDSFERGRGGQKSTVYCQLPRGNIDLYFETHGNQCPATPQCLYRVPKSPRSLR